MSNVRHLWARLCVAIPALLVATAARAQATGAPAVGEGNAAGSASVFTWFVILAVVAIAVFLIMTVGRRRRRLPVEPPRP